MTPEAQEKLVERTSKYLRSTLLSRKGGVEMIQLSHDYRKMVGEEIPYKRLNFPSLETFLQSLPKVCRVNGGLVTAVVSEATAHIGDMVAKQNTTKGKKGRVRGGCGRMFDYFGCESFEQSNGFDVVGSKAGPAPASYEDVNPPAPVLVPRNEVGIIVFEGRVKDLFLERPLGLYMSQVEKMYSEKHGESLPQDWTEQMVEAGSLKVENNIFCTLVTSASRPCIIRPSSLSNPSLAPTTYSSAISLVSVLTVPTCLLVFVAINRILKW